MTEQNRFIDRYKTGDIPWDVGKPETNLTETVKRRAVKGCKALEIGCGTGDNSIWLAANGFDVTGIDLSEIAIERAGEKALEAGAKCVFVVSDFLTAKLKRAPFGFAFDRGCFHSFRSEEEQRRFAAKVAAHLEADGLWLTIMGTADEHREDEESGPPQHTARDIVMAVEPFFEILSLESGLFTSNSPTPHKAWICLMRKRHVTQNKQQFNNLNKDGSLS